MSQRGKRIVLFVLWILFTLIVTSNAWLGDDAYITFRTIDNFLSGYGLRWNIAERVQSYSHPLWMMALTVLSIVHNDIYHTSIYFSIALTAIASFALLFALSRSLTMSLAICGAMIFSKAFVDYSTSGLENPLTHFLIVAFYVIYFRFSKSPKSIFAMYLIAGLAFLNRMDTILVLLPALARLLIYHRPSRNWKLIAGAAAPVAMWEFFSFIYYGSLVPNTAYAKLGTGIPTSELAVQAAHYYLNSLLLDHLTLPFIIIGIVSHYAIRRKLGNPVVEGAVLYLIYIVKIGGDFMSGRFFALPFLLICIYFVRHGFSHPKLNRTLPYVFIFLGLITPFNPVYNNSRYGVGRKLAGPARQAHLDPWGICDERGFYFRATGLIASNRVGNYPEHPWYFSALEDKRAGVKVIVQGSMGFYGWAIGPEIYVLDRYALCDPLLSRLPARRIDPDLASSEVMKHLRWRIGHFYRTLPVGYPEKLVDERTPIQDPKVAEYYEKIRLVTRGPLLSFNRLVAIIGLNVGSYDYLLDDFRKQVEAEDAQEEARRFSSED